MNWKYAIMALDLENDDTAIIELYTPNDWAEGDWQRASFCWSRFCTAEELRNALKDCDGAAPITWWAEHGKFHVDATGSLCWTENKE